MPKMEISYDGTYLQSLEALDIPDATVEFDPDADYARPMPPIPDGVYQAVLSNAGLKRDGKRVPFAVTPWKSFQIAVQAVLISDDPMINNRYVYTDRPLSTDISPKSKASSVSAAYKAITGGTIKGLPGLSWVKQLDEALQGSPVAWIEVENRLHDMDAEIAYSARKKNNALAPGETKPVTVYGAKKIMALKGGTDSSGKFTGAADHPKTGKRCPAKAVISAFKPQK